METNISHYIDAAGDRAKYDESVKKLLSQKVILAWILKTCTDEFQPYTIEFIMNKCIEGNPEISSNAVHQDQLDIQDYQKQAIGGNESIQGLNTEDNSIKEHTVTYDIRFSACVPEKGESVQMIINVEAQLDTTPGYPLSKRGIYYCCRMISSQFGTIFQEAEYDKIRKVYSIWICPEPAKKNSNTIIKYSISEECVLGKSEEVTENYDLMTMLILRLGEKGKSSENALIRLLSILLSSTTVPADKKRILHNDFNIAMTTELESEVFNMCNLSQGVWEEGREAGRKEGRKEGRIIGAVDAYRDAGLSDNQIVDKLIEKFQLSKDSAEKYVLT